jgi:hypothetical protein
LSRLFATLQIATATPGVFFKRIGLFLVGLMVDDRAGRNGVKVMRRPDAMAICYANPTIVDRKHRSSLRRCRDALGAVRFLGSRRDERIRPQVA